MSEEVEYKRPEEAFAAVVRSLRESSGWTQADLAERIAARGVPDASQVLISRIESGKRDVRLSEARALASVFRVSIEDMTAGSEAVTRLAVDHRQAREAFVRFREAVVTVTEWQFWLLQMAEAVREEMPVDEDEALQRLLRGVDDYVAIDLAVEAGELVGALREAREHNDSSRAGRFLNVTTRRRV